MPFEVLLIAPLLIAASWYLNKLYENRLGNEMGRQLDHRGIGLANPPSEVHTALSRIEQRLDGLEARVAQIERRDKEY